MAYSDAELLHEAEGRLLKLFAATHRLAPDEEARVVQHNVARAGGGARAAQGPHG